MDCKPKNADLYGWNRFKQWSKKVGINLEHEEDWLLWWECWQRGYLAGINGDN